MKLEINHWKINEKNMITRRLNKKAVLIGMFIVIQAFLKNELNLKQPNLPPKRLRKRRTNKT